MSESYLERITAAILKDAGIPTPIREFRFCEARRWRGDFVWVIGNKKVMLEVEGGTFMKNSGHASGTGIQRDIEKGNEAALLGYTVIRATKLHIINGQMLEWIKRALDIGGLYEKSEIK